MEPSFNAAAVGKQSKLNITAAYAMDFVGFENNPQTMYAAADLPFYFLKGLHGAGLQLLIRFRIGSGNKEFVGPEFACDSGFYLCQ